MQRRRSKAQPFHPFGQSGIVDRLHIAAMIVRVLQDGQLFVKQSVEIHASVCLLLVVS